MRKGGLKVKRNPGSTRQLVSYKAKARRQDCPCVTPGPCGKPDTL